MDPFKFEDNFAEACFTGLTARGIPHGTTRANAEEPREFVEVKAHGFHVASPKMVQSAGGTWFHSHYEGTLAFGVFTQVAGANAANHNVWVSNIRTMMSRTTQFFDSNNLPCYRIARVQETASDPDEIEKTDTYHTPITFIVGLEIIGSSVA